MPQSSVKKIPSDTPAGPSPDERMAPDCCLTHPLKMLVRITRQSQLGDPEACAAILALLSASRQLHNHLHRVLARLDLSEVKLTTLVSLYAIDPEPSTPADLALHAQVSRATMTDTLEALHTRNWIVRDRTRSDRRVLHIHLTDEGRALIERTVRPFLTTLNQCAQALPPEERSVATLISAHLTAFCQAHAE